MFIGMMFAFINSFFYIIRCEAAYVLRYTLVARITIERSDVLQIAIQCYS